MEQETAFQGGFLFLNSKNDWLLLIICADRAIV